MKRFKKWLLGKVTNNGREAMSHVFSGKLCILWKGKYGP